MWAGRGERGRAAELGGAAPCVRLSGGASGVGEGLGSAPGLLCCPQPPHPPWRQALGAGDRLACAARPPGSVRLHFTPSQAGEGAGGYHGGAPVCAPIAHQPSDDPARSTTCRAPGPALPPADTAPTPTPPAACSGVRPGHNPPAPV